MLLDVRQCEVDGGQMTLVGTRILTLEALEEIRTLFEKQQPTTVVLDYDATRWRWLDVLAGDGDVDLVQVIKSGEMSELNSRLAMGVLAKSVAPRAGVPEDLL